MTKKQAAATRLRELLEKATPGLTTTIFTKRSDYDRRRGQTLLRVYVAVPDEEADTVWTDVTSDVAAVTGGALSTQKPIPGSTLASIRVLRIPYSWQSAGYYMTRILSVALYGSESTLHHFKADTARD